MIADHLTGIEKFEADLWKVADNLRANSNLASNEYFMPILGLIFLRHATNRYYAALAEIEGDKAEGRMPDRPLVEADFTSRRALMLSEAARYDQLLEKPKDGNLGVAMNAAMEALEDHFQPLKGQLPKDYQRFEANVLEEMMRTFDSEALRTGLRRRVRPHLRILPRRVLQAGRARQRRVLHPALDCPDHRQRDRAGPRYRFRPRLPARAACSCNRVTSSRTRAQTR